MDPNAALEKAREAVRAFYAADAMGEEGVPADAAMDLLDAFEALDGWLKRGGYPPTDWNKMPWMGRA